MNQLLRRILLLTLCLVTAIHPPAWGTANQSGVFNFQALTSTGALAANYRLYTYSAGTTTTKTAYTDAAGSVAHTYVSDGIGGTYIALDARGELPAPLFLTSGSYDITLKTPAGVTVWTRRTDNIPGTSPILNGAGSVTAPSYSFTGDSNTGMWSPSSDILAWSVGGVELFRASTSGVLFTAASAGGIGYGAGSGGAVTQATSKSTSVTLNRATGQITLNNASLAANTAVQFTLTNSTIALTDVVVVTIGSGAAAASAYTITVGGTGVGSCGISIRNQTGGALAEALVLNFVVIKGAIS